MMSQSNTVGNFTFEFSSIEGVCLITPKVFIDYRGYFEETFNEEAFKEVGLPHEFKQDNHSCSVKGTLRGMHMQAPTAQGKLVKVLNGSVYDVAWDLRPGSKTFGSYFGVVLSAENKQMLYVPEGFAHGFLALEDCHFIYKCTNVYRPAEEMSILYDSYTIPWLEYARKHDIPNFLVSQKDLAKAITFEQYRNMYANPSRVD